MRREQTLEHDPELTWEALEVLVRLARKHPPSAKILYGPFVCFESRRTYVDATHVAADSVANDFEGLDTTAPWSEVELESSIHLPDPGEIHITLRHLWSALKLEAKVANKRPSKRMAARVYTALRALGDLSPVSEALWRKWRQVALAKFGRDEAFTRLIAPVMNLKRTRTPGGRRR